MNQQYVLSLVYSYAANSFAYSFSCRPTTHRLSAVTIWNFTSLTPVGHVIHLLCSFLMQRKLAVETLLQVAEPSVVWWLIVTMKNVTVDLIKEP